MNENRQTGQGGQTAAGNLDNASGSSAAAEAGATEEEADELRSEEILVLVTAQCGDASAAKDALEATKAANQSPREWADDALLWLAQRAELEPERQNLQQAMAISLQEAESITPSVPLVDWKADDLLKYFEKSAFLAQVELQKSAMLVHAPLRSALIPLLDLERSCQRWYPGQGVKAVFADLGQQCCGMLHGLQPAASGQATTSADLSGFTGAHKRQTCSASAATPYRMRTRSSVSPCPSSQETVGTAHQPTSKRGGRGLGRGAGRGRGRARSAAAAAQPTAAEQNGAAAAGANPAGNQKASQRQPAGTPEPDVHLPPEVCSKLCTFLTEQLAKLKEAVFAMPSTSGAAPAIFERAAAKFQDDAVQDADVVIAPLGKRQHRATDEHNPG